MNETDKQNRRRYMYE